jgi:hypothetical protein
MFMVMLLLARGAWADELDRICFFPDKVDFEEINKTCNKGELIRTKPPLAEMVCDWDKQIFRYSEGGVEWVTCVYHGKPRMLEQGLLQKDSD